MSNIEWYEEDSVLIVTLADSKNGNLLNINSLSRLWEILKDTHSQKRVVLIRSNGNNFCHGMDLKFLIENSKDHKTAENAIKLYSDLLIEIFESPVPVICLVNGSVKAGGIGLMGACDIIIASDNSQFELTEVLFGLVPFNVLPFIYSQRLAPKKAQQIILTTKKLSATDALQIGLIDELFTSADLEKGTKGIIKSILRSSPDALSATKKFCHSMNGSQFSHSITAARNELLELLKNDKVLNAIKAFGDGDLPEWFSQFKPSQPLVL